MDALDEARSCSRFWQFISAAVQRLSEPHANHAARASHVSRWPLWHVACAGMRCAGMRCAVFHCLAYLGPITPAWGGGYALACRSAPWPMRGMHVQKRLGVTCLPGSAPGQHPDMPSVVVMGPRRAPLRRSRAFARPPSRGFKDASSPRRQSAGDLSLDTAPPPFSCPRIPSSAFRSGSLPSWPTDRHGRLQALGRLFGGCRSLCRRAAARPHPGHQLPGRRQRRGPSEVARRQWSVVCW